MSSLWLGSDRLGWPTLGDKQRTTWQLWPVTWWHFELFVADGGLANSDYEAILSRSDVKRPAIGRVTAKTAQLRGVSSEQALEFAKWLGEGWRLPTDDEWCQFLHSVLDVDPLELAEKLSSIGASSNDYVLRMVTLKLVNNIAAHESMDELLLLGRYAYEWVTLGPRNALRGSNLANSGILSFVGDREPVQPLPGMLDRVLPFCGLRLVHS